MRLSNCKRTERQQTVHSYIVQCCGHAYQEVVRVAVRNGMLLPCSFNDDRELVLEALLQESGSPNAHMQTVLEQFVVTGR